MKQTKGNRPGTLRLAVIRGVDLRLHFSLLFLLLYVVLVSAAQFPAVAAQAGLSSFELSLGPWLAGLIVAIGLFFSVALHEFGHVWIAQAQGVKVKSVTLMMLGGMTEMGSIPERKFAELKMAIVGPLVSFALAGAMFFFRRYSISPDMSLLTYWLGSINLVLALFNLLPAFPMDGGRAFRSLIAAKTGQLQATRISVQVSKAFSWILGFLGLFSLNVLLVLIAFFIYSAADTEFHALLTRSLLRGIKVGEVMVRTPYLTGRTLLEEAAQLMLRSRKTVLPVLMEDRQSAVLSVDDLRRVPRDEWSRVTLAEVVLPASRVLTSEESVQQILGDMLMSSARALPVAESGHLVGVLRDTDISEILEFKSIENRQGPIESTEHSKAA